MQREASLVSLITGKKKTDFEKKKDGAQPEKKHFFCWKRKKEEPSGVYRHFVEEKARYQNVRENGK